MEKGDDQACAEVEEDRKGNPAVIIDGLGSRIMSLPAFTEEEEEEDRKGNPAVVIDGFASRIMS
jgi:hypothetical protein